MKLILLGGGEHKYIFANEMGMAPNNWVCFQILQLTTAAVFADKSHCSMQITAFADKNASFTDEVFFQEVTPPGPPHSRPARMKCKSYLSCQPCGVIISGMYCYSSHFEKIC